MSKTKTKVIKIWWFEDAPKEYQEASTSGGDEDWIVFIPTGIDYPIQLENLGCCSNNEFLVAGGKIIIATHA